MFKKKTVFVIGAGGSQDFGLPLGSELKGQIAEVLKSNPNQTNGNAIETGRHYFNAIRSITKSNPLNRNLDDPYWIAGEQIASAMPTAISIDNFLQTHSDNEIISKVGKLGIAHAILEAERKNADKLGRTSIFSKITTSGLQGTWLLEFVKILLEGVARGDTSTFANVEIVTFNYDRCIEVGLSNAIANQWLIPTDEARNAASKINIIHVYGTVGLLPWQTGNGHKIEFGAELSGAVLKQSASMLRTFSETDETNETEDKIQELVRQSERIVFIGFSFMSINMKYFLLSDKNKRREVIATAWGLSSSDRRSIESELANLYLGGLEAASWENKNILMFEEVKGAKLLADYARILAS